MDKWQEWAEGQRRNGYTLTLDNGNEHCAAVLIERGDTPTQIITVPASALPVIFPEASDAR